MALKFRSDLGYDLYFTSDLHFGHKNILKFQPNRQFSSIEEMDSYIIDNSWNKTVNDNDKVFFLGDFSWYKEDRINLIFDQLKGEKYIVRGNHDKKDYKIFKNQKDYMEIWVDDQFIVLCHYPIFEWNKKHYGAWMLHGHVHGRKLGIEGRIVDVGIDNSLNLSLFDYNSMKLVMDLVDYR